MPAETEKVTLAWPNGIWRLGRADSTGKDHVKKNVAPTATATSGSEGELEIPHDWLTEGENLFLARFSDRLSAGLPSPLGSAANAKIIARFQPSDGPPLIVDEVFTDIRAVREWVSMFSSRPASSSGTPTRFSPLPKFELEPDWHDVPTDATDVTIAVHGFNVTDAGAATFASTYMKRLYWTGHPVLQVQRATSSSDNRVPWFVGLSWPGDAGPTLPTNVPIVGGMPLLEVPGLSAASFLTLLYLPTDEFHAFQTGVPLALLLRNLKEDGPSSRKLRIVAHSLGNLVVNSALAQPDMGGIVDSVVMNQAAVTSEAFGGGTVTDADLTANARDQGYPDDVRWANQWGAMNQEHCGSYSCSEPECTGPIASPPGDDYSAWCLKRALNESELVDQIHYAERWTKYASRNNRPWYAVFEGNRTRTAIFNTYYQDDYALRALLPLVWNRQRPDLGVATAIGGDVSVFDAHPFGVDVDDRKKQFWATLDQNLPAQEYLWRQADPGNTHHAPTSREWAELAYYFAPLSQASGANIVAALGPQNFDMGPRIAGIPALFSVSWREVVGDVFEQILEIAKEAAKGEQIDGILQATQQRLASHPELAWAAAQLQAETNAFAGSDTKDPVVANALKGILWQVFKSILVQYAHEIEISHGYMTGAKVGDVWCGYELMESLFRTGHESECSKPK
jgi:hypothetical protein